MSTPRESKNILHITYDMRIGGTEMVIKNIIEGNLNPALNMSVYCIEKPIGPWGLDMQNNGVEVDSIARSDGFDFSVIKALRKHIKQHDIHILHCHQYTPWVYGTLAAFGTQAKVIFTEHGRFYPDYSSWKRRFVNPLLAIFTYKITAISKATKQALVDYEFLSASRIEVIYNGIKGLEQKEHVTVKIRDELNIKPEATIFGTIARLDPIKNHDMMLHAFASTKKSIPNAVLIIVGDGELMQTLQALAKRLKLDDSVIFTGYISYPKDYLALFDIFLLSSLSEGTSMTLLEAMSLGKPCVVTDAGGNKEIVIHRETGLVTDNDNMSQFSEAMIAAVSDSAQSKNFRIKASVRFTEKFDQKHMIKEYQRLYIN
jgi:glycosyltransferase involved in cell wall biosynthesis